MKFWKDNVDKILEFNERPLLKDKETISKDIVEQKVKINERKD